MDSQKHKIKRLTPRAAPTPQGGAGCGAEHARDAPPVTVGKEDKRPRPQLIDMTEHDFNFFENEWLLYKRQAGQTLMDELYSMMSTDLGKLAYDKGDIDTITAEAAMLEDQNSHSLGPTYSITYGDTA